MFRYCVSSLQSLFVTQFCVFCAPNFYHRWIQPRICQQSTALTWLWPFWSHIWAILATLSSNDDNISLNPQYSFESIMKYHIKLVFGQGMSHNSGILCLWEHGNRAYPHVGALAEPIPMLEHWQCNCSSLSPEKCLLMTILVACTGKLIYVIYIGQFCVYLANLVSSIVLCRLMQTQQCGMQVIQCCVHLT
jgi:hypothetical protein